jgi:hypothetical protein
VDGAQAGWDVHAAFVGAFAKEGSVLLGSREGDGDSMLLIVDADGTRRFAAAWPATRNATIP